MTLRLCLFGRERIPRPVSDDETEWKWTKAWANRWWLVRATDLAHARQLIRDDIRAYSPEAAGTDGILDCGRNGRGGLGRASSPGVKRTTSRAGDRRALTTARRPA